jgi:hypothetical protein
VDVERPRARSEDEKGDDSVGSGTGNAIIVPSSGVLKIIVLARNPNNPDILNTLVPVSDYKISPKAGILIYGPEVEEWNGWTKVSANGVDYPVAGPGSSIVINGQTISPCTSCQNHDALNFLHIVVPDLPIPDGTDVTVKLFKNLPVGPESVTTDSSGVTSMALPGIDTSKGSYVVSQTFKYYRNPQIPASDPYIMPDADPNQNYNKPLTLKIGSSSVVWERVIAGSLPTGFDINGTSLIYNPVTSYVKPKPGDVFQFVLWGTMAGQNVVQKFKIKIIGTNSGSSSSSGSGNSLGAKN